MKKKTTWVMAALISIPVLLTFTLWTVMPSGYHACNQKTMDNPTSSIWDPLQAGLKQVTFSFQ